MLRHLIIFFTLLTVSVECLGNDSVKVRYQTQNNFGGNEQFEFVVTRSQPGDVDLDKYFRTVQMHSRLRMQIRNGKVLEEFTYQLRKLTWNWVTNAFLLCRTMKTAVRSFFRRIRRLTVVIERHSI